MTPFGGVGVNLAMQDAMELAEAIVRNRENLDEAVQLFEETMLKRAAKEAADTRQNLDWMLGTEAPMGIVNFFLSAIPPQQ